MEHSASTATTAIDSRARWLLVEDNTADAAMVSNWLLHAGCDPCVDLGVHHVKSLGEALTQLARASEIYRGVVLDLNLPDVTGLEGVELISGRYGQLPLLVVSGHPEDEAGQPSLDAGATCYLSKEDWSESALAAILARLGSSQRASQPQPVAPASSMRDSETSLRSLGAFTVLAQHALHTAQRNRLLVAFVLVRPRSDSLTHHQLRNAASLLRREVRRSDVAGRIGPSSLGLVGTVERHEQAEQFRQRIARRLRQTSGGTWHTGLAFATPGPELQLQHLLDEAERDLPDNQRAPS